MKPVPPEPSVHPGPTAPAALPARRTRPPLRPGRKTILVSACDGEELDLALAFARSGEGIEVWRSLHASASPLTFVGVFPGRFGPRAVARLLASGAVGPHLDPDSAEFVEVDGVEEPWDALLPLAWTRVDGRPDARVEALLRLDDAQLADVEKRVGGLDGKMLLDVGDYLLRNDRAWLEKWRSSVEEEVEARVAREGSGGEARRATLRAFVEECLLVLGRLPRSDEAPGSWDGVGLRERPPGWARQGKLGLRQSGRVRRFHVAVVFWTAADTYGYSDFGPGPGWYWIVRNPDPGWRFCDPTGPYATPDEAWSDASCLGQDE